MPALIIWFIATGSMYEGVWYEHRLIGDFPSAWECEKHIKHLGYNGQFQCLVHLPTQPVLPAPDSFT